MKKSIILITLLFALLLSSCVTDTEVNGSVVPKDEGNSDSYSESSIVNSDTTPTSDTTEPLNSSDDSDDSGYFKVITESSAYEFYPDKQIGSYYTQFHSAKTTENSITITLLDGRNMQLNYTDIVFDEENQFQRTTINELDFKVSEIHDSDNSIIQVFDCIEPLDNLGKFNGKVDYTIRVTYKPELESGEINMSFIYEVDGDNYIISYPDGRELTKTVEYNEETETYYFAE